MENAACRVEVLLEDYYSTRVRDGLLVALDIELKLSLVLPVVDEPSPLNSVVGDAEIASPQRIEH